MKLGIACRDGAPPSDVVELLCEAGLCGGFSGLRAPALVREPAPDDHLWLLASAADVAGACERGALDAGVVGKDALLEAGPELHELLDLGADRDALVYALRERPQGLSRRPRPRVATRYVRVTRSYLAGAGEQADVLAFDSPVLAVGLGLADGVVELRRLVDAGAGEVLRERAEVAACSARLVCGRAAHTLSGAALEDLVGRLRARLEAV